MLTESATRKRVYSVQSERNPSWISTPFAPFTPFGLANGSEITPPFEKRLRTVKKPMSTFKWEPDLPGNLQFSEGYGFRNVEVKTPLPAAWRPSRGLSTPPYVRNSRERYEGVKEEMRQRSSWFSKLDRSTALAEDALDRVGRPVIGLNLTLGPSESYYQKYVNAKRELEDYKRVVNAVNSYVPLTSNGSRGVFSSLESMRRRGSNLQQGPRNLYNIQEAVLRESQTGGGHSISRMANGNAFRRTEYDEAQRQSELQVTDAATGSGPESSVQPAGASVSSDDEQNEDWQTLMKKAQITTSRIESRERDIEALTEQWSRLQLHRGEDEVRRQKEREASKKEEVVCRLHFWYSCVLKCCRLCL